MKKNYILILIAGMAIWGCKTNILPEKAEKGNADFSKYVAIGNSLTAGYADNSLSKSGQEMNYPLMLSKKFASVGGGEFKQPYLLDDIGWPANKLILGLKPNCATGDMTLGPLPVGGSPNPANADNVSNKGPFNNLGIPGIRCIDILVDMYGYANPYANRMLSDSEKRGKILTTLLNSQPTFFTLWLGNNDVLGYATSGGQGSSSGVSLGDISPSDIFKIAYDTLISGLVANGAKGVLLNIPDVSATPFFTLIPYNGLVLSRQGQVDSLNFAYSPFGITFQIGANPFIIQDPTGSIRTIKSNEYILMTASDSLTCGGWGSVKPIPPSHTLTEEEVNYVKNATNDFNQIIAQNAAKHQLALLDVNAFFKEISTGLIWNGIKLSPTYVTGGLFSLDGVHLTPKGYALVANQIIKTINNQYKSTLSQVDLNDYPAVIFP